MQVRERERPIYRVWGPGEEPMAPRLSTGADNEPSHPPVGVTESRNQKFHTTTQELKGSADQSSGGAYGTSPPGTDGVPFINQSFPTSAKERAKNKDAEDKSKGIENIVRKEATGNREAPC